MRSTHRRPGTLDLAPHQLALFRAIASELESVNDSISEEAQAQRVDLQALAAAMADRRHLIGWLHRLNLPPASEANDCGLTPEVEQLLLSEGCCDQEAGE